VYYSVGVIRCSLISTLLNIIKQLRTPVFENVSLYAWLNTVHIMFRGRNHNFSNRKCYFKGSRKVYISIDCVYPLDSYYHVNITCYKSNNNRCFAVVAFWVGTLLSYRVRRYEHLECEHIDMPDPGLGRNFTDDIAVIFSTSGKYLDGTSIDARPLRS
jgi:hypothetical protein